MLHITLKAIAYKVLEYRPVNQCEAMEHYAEEYSILS